MSAAEARLIDEFEETWRRFHAQPRTKPSAACATSLSSSESDYLIYLIALDQESSLAAAIGRLQARLDLPYVDPIPPEALHITVQGVDYRDRLSARQQADLVQRAAPVFARLAPFEATIRSANSFDVAAFYEVHDGGALREVRARLREALPWLVAENRDPLFRSGQDVFLPHVSAAYYNGEADAREAAKVLAAHRDEVVGKVRVSDVKLVAVRLPFKPDGVHFRIEATFRLGSRNAVWR